MTFHLKNKCNTYMIVDTLQYILYDLFTYPQCLFMLFLLHLYACMYLENVNYFDTSVLNLI